MAKNSGWVPQQHGAWAMLAVPSLVGLVRGLSWDPGPARTTGRLVLVAAFVVGYFAFNAVSLMIKTARRRRRRLARPVIAYTVATAALGLVAAALLGPALLTWALAFAPLAAAALLLVWMRQERSTVSGGLTVAAACLFAVTVAHPDFLGYVERWSAPEHVTSRWTAILCFLYFFGTVWAVKTMIRQRGSLWWWLASIAYHLIALGLVVLGVVIGRLHPAWPALYAVTTLRAAVLPRIGPMARPPRSISPLSLGLVELVFSVALTLLLLSLPPH